MRRIMLRNILSVCLLIWLVFCPFKAYAASELHAGNNDDLRTAPEWVFNPRKGAREGELAAVGIARIENGSITDARKTAVSRAVGELAMVMQAKVSSVIKDYTSSPVDKPALRKESVDLALKISIPDKLNDLTRIIRKKMGWTFLAEESIFLLMLTRKEAKK